MQLKGRISRYDMMIQSARKNKRLNMNKYKSLKYGKIYGSASVKKLSKL